MGFIAWLKGKQPGYLKTLFVEEKEGKEAVGEYLTEYALTEASTADVKEAHVQQAQRVKAGEMCPYCGRELVRRQGRYGEFMGCSGYPKCRYTRKV